MIGSAGKLGAQFRILRRHAHRTGVEVADPHHNAAHRNQRRSREAKFLSPQQRGDNHIAPGLELAIGLHDDAAAQVVEHQRLMRLGQPQLPRQASVLDRGLRRGSGAAVVARNQHHVRVALGHSRGDRADPELGDQLDVDPRIDI